MTATPDLKPASESPWYVLMTVAGAQTGFLIDDDLHARNLRFWDGWAGGLPTFGAECRFIGA